MNASERFRLCSSTHPSVWADRKSVVIEHDEDGLDWKKWTLETVEESPRLLVGYYITDHPSGGILQIGELGGGGEIWYVSIPLSEMCGKSLMSGMSEMPWLSLL